MIDITVLLDRSGSMASIKADTLGGFNTFLAKQQAEPDPAVLNLIQFDTMGYDRIIDAQPIKEAPPLTEAMFQPRGGTPLLDAMGRTISEAGERFKAMATKPKAVVMVIITDGEENSSHAYTHAQVMEMVKHQTEVYKWTFVYLGANQDAIQAGGSMGFAAASSATYTMANTRMVYDIASDKMSAMRGGIARGLKVEEAAMNMMFNDDDRKQLSKDEK